MNIIEAFIEEYLVHLGVAAESAVYLRLVVLLAVLCIIAAGAYFITKKIVVRFIYNLFRRSPIKWDDILVENNVLNHLSHLVPAIFVRMFSRMIFKDFESLIPVLEKATDIYLIIVITLIISSLIKTSEMIFARMPAFIDKPVASYFQLLRIIIYIAAGIFVLSILIEQSPMYLLSAFGAMTAITMLVFKDTILGLVASIQISSSDMVRVGDWIEMPKYNADGDVIAMNLNTIKIQNWDKTITTIPTYYLITDSFKNWRGMSEGGGRRIKRSIFINVNSVKFVSPEDRERFKQFQLVSDFISERQQEIESYNKVNKINTKELINGRRMTNLGVFRQYIALYLKNHPMINHDMTLLVRQLSAEDRGIPLEIYCFTTTTAWAEYEGIQSDIFDHLFAAAAFFDVEIFQQPGGRDITSAALSVMKKAERTA